MSFYRFRAPSILKHLPQHSRVANRIAVAVIVEIRPDPLRSAGADFLRPFLQLHAAVIVTIPLINAVKADIDFVGGLDQIVWQARPAAGTEDDPGFAKGGVNIFIPSALMAELDHIAARRVHLPTIFLSCGNVYRKLGGSW